ncbi:YbjN domain-containing protein [Cyanobacteria bacterium FACHB-63]|nr:YbjN domain-containing protein [Cyanobacteria bacterium FACHB-63]
MTNYQQTLETSDANTAALGHEAIASVDLIQVIETVISSLDQTDSAMVSHTKGEGGYVWKFKYGSVETFVQLTGTTEGDTLTVWASVLKLPVQNEPQLMRKLLEMNWLTTLEAHFAIFNGEIAVVSSRTVADLSPGEISRLITLVATIADEKDDALQAEFGSA